jgi:hypothetical protein
MVHQRRAWPQLGAEVAIKDRGKALAPTMVAEYLEV